MRKLLYISNIAGSKASVNFFGSAMTAAKHLDIEFYVVANRSASSKEQIAEDEKEYGVHLLHADIARSPFSISNIRAYKQIVEIIKEREIDYIHCNTPVGGVIGRLAGKKCRVNKVIYQAHGFHFYKGSPLKNWIMYYPVEKILARLTDVLITINQEDFEIANRLRLRENGKIYYIPGVGIDLQKYNQNQKARETKRKKMGLQDEVVLISMGDLIPRKNYETAIRAVAESACPNILYWICGSGPLEESLKKLTEELNVSNQVRFLGFRDDVVELLNAADMFILTSFQEGLPRSTSEAMASGLPCLVSAIRGNVDLVENGKGGWLYDPKDIHGFARGIKELAESSDIRKRMSESNLIRIRQFDNSTVATAIQKIYEEELKSE